MKKLLTLISLMLLLAAETSATSATSVLGGAEQQRVIDKINAASSAINSLTASFVQVKQLSLLNDKLSSRGQMAYTKPDRLRWEYTSPYSYLFVINGSKVQTGGNARKDVIDTASNKLFAEVTRIMMASVTGKALADKQDFDISVGQTSSVWEVTLLPRKKTMRQMMSRIELLFAKNSLTITQITITEKNGDRTVIKLSDVKTNVPVKDSLFAIP
ncbi:MAG: outer membrane lipoprotein carrier protein LolA [Candidatus Amulumruptor caecigallinarius]|nr:outer membrane lipoprotein carrier protein LolA [Candidatus Amulumruptor caecigallinarius]MCM1396354.1 outer membrane lipoprotein carrier protein LolA [Candidatus Amulumruptor caecigallinarius]MCM1453704.1 outer membrane lipoprotein carrier protein LolA [bacterium]